MLHKNNKNLYIILDFLINQLIFYLFASPRDIFDNEFNTIS